MTVLVLDGGKNVGYALFSDSGEEYARDAIDFDKLVGFGALGIDMLTGWLYFDYTRIDRIVVEGFRHDPNVKQGGSLHWASQVEGAVKVVGDLLNLPYTVQYAGQALPVAKQITGYKGDLTKTGNKKHLPDQDSAWLHGVYFFHCQGIWRDEWKVS